MLQDVADLRGCFDGNPKMLGRHPLGFRGCLKMFRGCCRMSQGFLKMLGDVFWEVRGCKDVERCFLGG